MIDTIEDDLRLIELFRQKAADIRAEAVLRTYQRLDEEIRQRRDVKRRKEEEARELEDALATTAQIAAFNEHLDDYDTATVHALMDNQHALDLIFKQRGELEAAAFRLPDGRMAFKSADGKHVFDEHGAEFGPGTIEPDAIPSGAPTWEAKQAIDAATGKLIGEREGLHEYQKRLDEAREAASRNSVTADALAKLDDGLQKAMPDAVRVRLSGTPPEAGATVPKDLPAPTPTALRTQLSVPAGP